jgi:molybdate transport repressor ModE-like protein
MGSIRGHGLDQRRLEHFLAVARQGSINGAARDIGISQAGLTRSIQTLEESLGTPLFVRGPKGVRPTAVGETLLAHAELIQNMYGAAAREVEATRSGKAGTLKIGIGPHWFLQQAMPAVMTRLLQDPREPHFRLISGPNSWQLLEQLARGELDMVMGAPTAFDATSQFVFLHGATDLQGVLVAKDHPLAHNAADCDLDALDAAGWVLAEEDTFYRRLLAGIYQSQGRLLPPPLVTSHSNIVILEILARSRHVGVGTRLLAEMTHAEQLTMLNFPPQVKRPVGIIHRRDDPLTAIGRLLIERMLEALAQLPQP